MTDFNFVTNETDSSQTSVKTHVFRRLNEDRESSVEVKCSKEDMWSELEEVVGDGWIAYQWLGPKDRVESMIDGNWDSFSELPYITMSHNRR